MVFLVFLIGVLNISLGFAVAVWLGYGPPGLWEAWDALVMEQPPTAATPAPEPSPTADLRAVALEDMLDAGEEDDLAPLELAYDDDVADLMRTLGPDGPEHWDLSEKYVETSILRLNIAMMRSGKRSTEIDSRLRACAGGADEATIEECLALLREDCETYLADQSAASEKFRERIGELGELSALGDEIDMANLEQAAQIETTLSNLQYMDFRSDLEAARVRLLTELARLREARHHLRDSQEAAFLTIARYENRLDKIESQLFHDPLTGLRNRIGVETTLAHWWEQGRQRSRPMTVVLLDIDGFGPLNEARGPLVCDRLLWGVGRLLVERSNEADLVGRFAGQRFLVVSVDLGPRAALKNAELLRQTIEKTEFKEASGPVAIRVSLGVAEVKPEEAYHDSLRRAEEALREAKRAGGNGSALHTGRDVERVEAPNLGVEPLEVVLPS